MMSDVSSLQQLGQRGPVEHTIREQIVTAAGGHFRHYGYAKTTVSDLAKAIGFSKAYIYKFFESKQAIGEAICEGCIGEILDAANREIATGVSATDKIRRLFRTVTAKNLELFFQDRKLFDMISCALTERWGVDKAYGGALSQLLVKILIEGRTSGEFERKTPLDETCRAILQAMQPFIHPMMLEHNLEQAPEASAEVVSLILRSLAS